MFIPNGFTSSSAVRRREYDAEGRLRETRIGPGPHSDGESGIAEANSRYATDAEMFGTISPFLKRNKARDAQRRNYVIQPGGACIYFENEKELEDPYGGGRVQYTDAPTEKESFGHDSMPGGPTQGVQGRRFSLTNRGGGQAGSSGT